MSEYHDTNTDERTPADYKAARLAYWEQGREIRADAANCTPRVVDLVRKVVTRTGNAAMLAGFDGLPFPG